MREKVIIALISGLLVLLGVVVTQIFELFKRKSEEKRWYADYFLPKKFDAIYNLYSQLQTAHDITIYQARKLKDDDEFQESVVKKVNHFGHSYHNASIYLSDKERIAVDEFYNLIKEAALHIRSLIDPIIYVHEGIEKEVIVDWPEDLEKKYQDAKKKLAKKLTPSILDEMEKDWI